MSITSEHKQRSLAKGIVGENFKAERAPFSCDKHEFQEVPFVYRPNNLIAAIADTVDQHEGYVINYVFN